eukprot:gnl/MRDRNA2_/MRDRNA2_100128_c0_seq1.p1 gnl/MRDRNA2_/MRDRNA2_100128_c0~~gnl/MRDRNA2_/MRDRNA2_100128_c0_seq1.p1  ORF type:complete len:545 (+),score=109.41 gnl/MRDRNA2_/MRDRNA2_100128_c0_seq1:214-1848(+)
MAQHNWTKQSLGRQTFMDAKHQDSHQSKLSMLANLAANKSDMGYDSIFGFFIFLNLITMGAETEYTARKRLALGSLPKQSVTYEMNNPFFWIESFFLVAFLVEFALRIRHLRRLSSEADSSVQDLQAADAAAPLSSTNMLIKASSFRPWESSFVPAVWRSLDKCSNLMKKYAWLAFDFILIALSALDVWIISFITNESFAGGGTLTTLRILRVLRVVRTVKIFHYSQDLMLILLGLIQSLRVISWVILMMILLHWVSAIFLVRLFYLDQDQQDDELDKKYGGVARCMYTLFQVTTMEGWAQTAEVLGFDWRCLFFFTCFVMLSHYTVINLLVGVICENVQDVASTEDVDLLTEITKKRQERVERLRRVFDNIDLNKDGDMTKAEFNQMLDQPEFMQEMAALQFDQNELRLLFETLDVDFSGTLQIQEFIEGCMEIAGSQQTKSLMLVRSNIVKEIRSSSRKIGAHVGEIKKTLSSESHGQVSYTHEVNAARNEVQGLSKCSTEAQLSSSASEPQLLTGQKLAVFNASASRIEAILDKLAAGNLD